MSVLISGETEEDNLVFESEEDVIKLGVLVARHFNYVNEQLHSKNGYFPVLLEDDEGQVQVNDWAKGFLVGVDMRPIIWKEFFQDDEQVASMVPIWALAYEHDPDPKMRSYKEPVTPELREELVVGAAEGAMRIYRYFLPKQDQYLGPSRTFVRPGPKTGRNDPCPCGAGKKFKKCCGKSPVLR